MSSSTTSTGSPSSTTTSSMSTPSGNSRNDNEGPAGRPLLFFVALGFGVVFTNLWIIVGVKYCFRYNQRARQGAIEGDGGEPIDLPHMARPRRRKEKKLMTMEEVNERFPLTKYKIWRATREMEGLPAPKGVNAPPERAESIKEAVRELTSADQGSRRSGDVHEDSVPSSSGQQRSSGEAKDLGVSGTGVTSIDSPRVDEKMPPYPHDPQNTTTSSEPLTFGPSADDDEDDPIRTAVPTELLQQPGDACAICIDTIEDEDEVRGLTCGHAFHAGCLDPWLTSRRACCPLCKADYYIPKARPEGESTGTEAGGRRNPQVTMPPNVWMGGRGGVPFRPRIIIAGSRFAVDHHDRYGFPVLVREPRRQRQTQQQQELDGPSTDQTNGQGRASRVGARALEVIRNIPAGLRAPMIRGRRQANTSNNDQSHSPEIQTTPGQLEAGPR